MNPFGRMDDLAADYVAALNLVVIVLRLGRIGDGRTGSTSVADAFVK